MSQNRSALYVRHILKPTYDFTREHHFKYIIEINLAHILMLYKNQIVNADTTRDLCQSLLRLYEKGYDKAYDPSFEDLFFMLEHELEQELGPEKAGNLHIAFSRNDMDATMFRMFWREKVLMWLESVYKLRATLLGIIDQHRTTVMPAYTHHQQAQPTTLAHYLLAVDAHLERDMERGFQLMKRINCCPLGAAALGTTGFPIDREYVQQLLGFDCLLTNSYDSIAAADYIFEFSGTLLTSLSSLSRVVYDFLFMTSNEVATLKLADAHVQTSSIMPQKRNPSALEHTRALISRAIGQIKAVFMFPHNTPFGDIVDIGDDIQPQVYQGLGHTLQVNQMLSEVLEQAEFNAELLLQRTKQGFATVTELADILVRKYDVSFRKAHGIVSKYVKYLASENKNLLSGHVDLFNDFLKEEGIQISEQDYRNATDPEMFVQIRRVIGGPAPEETKRQYLRSLENLNDMTHEVDVRRKKLQKYVMNLIEEARRVVIKT